MPLLLRALELPDNDLRANVIDTLTSSSENRLQEPEFISEHASTLLSAMLKNSLVKEVPSAVGLQ
jgi:DNA repair/transcription protein MET18/MMS19